MIARLFIYIYNRISFTFAIALFTTTWSWVASFYGFFFVYATVNVRRDELLFLLAVLVICTGIAIMFHLTSYGMFHKQGYSGFFKKIRLINIYFDNKYIFSQFRNLTDKNIQDVYPAIAGRPQNNMFTALGCTGMVILSLVIIMYLNSGEFEKVFFILLGGIFASLIIGYCTFLLTEYFTGPYKMRLENTLVERSIGMEKRNLLSFKYKSIIMLMMILFSMVNLTILIWRSDKSILEIVLFICLSIITAGLLIFLMLNILNISLDTINRSTKRLASGGSGMFFPPFNDKEFITFSENYNRAAMEINEIRMDLETKISERTEELSAAYERLNKTYGQIQADLTLAKRIQKRIMPDNFKDIAGVDLLVHYYPLADIGGEIFDIIQTQPGYGGVFLGGALGPGL